VTANAASARRAAADAQATTVAGAVVRRCSATAASDRTGTRFERRRVSFALCAAGHWRHAATASRVAATKCDNVRFRYESARSNASARARFTRTRTLSHARSAGDSVPMGHSCDACCLPYPEYHQYNASLCGPAIPDFQCARVPTDAMHVRGRSPAGGFRARRATRNASVAHSERRGWATSMETVLSASYEHTQGSSPSEFDVYLLSFSLNDVAHYAFGAEFSCVFMLLLFAVAANHHHRNG
jgi:hypothetical protein